jgi:hypothetical protein
LTATTVTLEEPELVDELLMVVEEEMLAVLLLELVEVIEELVLLLLVVDDEEVVVVCGPQLDPEYTASIVVGLVIVIDAGSAVLPLRLPPSQ